MNLLNERARHQPEEPPLPKGKRKPGRRIPHPLEQVYPMGNSKELSCTFHDGKELQRNPNTTQQVNEPL